MSDRTTSTRSRQSPVVGRSFARAQVYELLAQLVAYPGEDVVRRCAELGPRALAAADYLRFPATAMERAVEGMERDGLDDLERAYQRCFTLSYSPDVPAHETAYVSSDIFRQTQEMADIAGFYRAFGAEIGGEDIERVDHIAVELSFMQMLCLKEAYAAQHREQEHLRVCRAAQRSFLRDHLLCWAPAFAERLRAVGGASVYGETGSLLLDWLRREATMLRAAPKRSYDRPLPPEPEPEAACEAGSVIALEEIT